MHRVRGRRGRKRVEFIGFNPRENTPSVWFSGGGTLCQDHAVPTQPAQAAAAAAPIAAPLPPASNGPSPVPADISSKIQKVSDTEFNIESLGRRQDPGNQAELMKSARIVPETQGRQSARYSPVRYSPGHLARNARSAEWRPTRSHQRL